MKLFTKAIVLAAAFSGALLSAAEVINFIDAKTLTCVSPSKKFKIENNTITHTGKNLIFSKKQFKIDPAKKYTFKYTIENKSDKILTVYGGVNIIDAKSKTYHIWAWQGNKATFTEVVADAKKGDTELKVKNGQAWGASNAIVIANAKEDGSDIPNSNQIAQVIKKAKVGDEWVFTLKAPLKSDIAAGTKIRQHYAGGYFYLRGAAPTRIAPGKTAEINSVVQGYEDNAAHWVGKKWPKNSAKAVFLLLSDYADVKADVVIKDATLTIE